MENKKNILKITLIAIISLIVLLISVLIFGKKSTTLDGETENSTNSKFEKEGQYYVLKDENGNILLDNVSSYGSIYNNEFCNGTINVTMSDGREGIINSNGKFITKLGEYSFIKHEACYYIVSSDNGKKILKYDGSLFFEDSNDKHLDKNTINCPVDYCFSKKVALFTASNKYQLLDSKGKVINEYEKNNDDKPVVKTTYSDEKEDSYISVFYQNQTEIYDTKTFKLISKKSGNYYIKGVKHESKEAVLLLQDKEGEKETILLVNGKEILSTTKCLNALFEDNETVRCILNDSTKTVKFYDLNGNEISR